MSAQNPLGFPDNVRCYWRHLVLLTLFPPFSVLLIVLSGEAFWAMVLTFVVFFPVSFYGAIPSLTKKVKISYSIASAFAYVVVGGGLALLTAVTLRAISLSK